MIPATLLAAVIAAAGPFKPPRSLNFWTKPEPGNFPRYRPVPRPVKRAPSSVLRPRRKKNPRAATAPAAAGIPATGPASRSANISESASDAPFRAGFVTLAGRPNVGKSTLLNAFLKSKLSIVSPKPQTTRHKILGILNGPDYQLCFLDTPGLLTQPQDPLQKSLLQAARSALRSDADVIVLLVDQPPQAEGLREIAALLNPNVPVVLVVNKIDLNPPKLDETEAAWREGLKPCAVHRVSAKAGAGVDGLLRDIIGRLPAAEAFYPRNQLSDRWERFYAAEIIREQIFELFQEEIPHACAVVIEVFRETKGEPDEVFATVFAERESQKGILIGKQGQMIRALTQRSEQSLETFLGRPVRLELRIKVRQNWRKDPRALKEFGYSG